ncbi:FecR family protein [Azospirillum brasilense]|uniref:FecR family protein n=1 Tax=Azospirillum brasilense TaxID=192 RepID=A0A560B1B2_AZOBR|nr:FecR family protein [Azospirillum brasilense]TWA66416.1 FecR family protein [Azospirillum brasilense]
MEKDEADGRQDAKAYRHADPVIDEALTWFVTLLDAPVDPDTRAAYQAWRNRDPRHAAAFDRLSSLGSMPELQQASTLAHHPQTSPPPLAIRSAARSRGWFGGWRASLAAAALLLAIGVHLQPTLALRLTADHRTDAGERREIALPDRSRLILDTDSAVALDFAEGRRHVRLLRGQAYFDVVGDPAHPFRVTAGFSEVEVTGTAFTVRSDGGQDAVFLERGRVSVSRREPPGQTLSLVPGDRVTATADGLSAPARPDPAVALAWKDGRYVFRDQPFATVVDTLRRYHGAPIVLIGDRLAGARVSGNYRLDDPVAAIRSLADVVGAHVTELPAGLILLR